MQLYLPIAEMAVSVETIFVLSAVVGLVSGLFGVGGGFLTTPFLIFIGIPPTVAVGTQASQLVASSMAGSLGHLRRHNVDLKMGCVMMVGGLLGSFLGIFIFKFLQYLGQIDFAISMLYILLLGGIGSLMFLESVASLFKKKEDVRKAFNNTRISPFILALPYKMRFPRSKLFISAFVPGAIGFIGGVLASVLGIGGGFLIVPAMIYILGMPPLLVAGTALFQVIFTTGSATIMHAVLNNTVDIVLAIILILGSVVGAQIGVSISWLFKGRQVRVFLALIVLAVCAKLMVDLFMAPDDIFSTVMAQ